MNDKNNFGCQLNKLVKSANKLESIYVKNIHSIKDENENKLKDILTEISSEYDIPCKLLFDKYLSKTIDDESYNDEYDTNEDNNIEYDNPTSILKKKEINGTTYYIDSAKYTIYNSQAKPVGKIKNNEYILD